MRSRTLSRPSVAPRSLAAAILAAALATSAASAREALTLRVNDAIAEPGGLAAIVVRTYASKPISQGQVCLLARSAGRARLARAPETAGAAGIFSSIEGFRVFGNRRGLEVAAVMETVDGQQMLVIEFSSASSSINRSDGPLAVIWVRLRGDAAPGSTFEIAVDAANTFVRDRSGAAIRIRPRAGELTVRHPSDPHLAEAEGDRVHAGDRAETGVETFEPVAMAAGQIGFLYEPEIASGRVQVRMRRKHGRRRFSVDRSTPGLLLVRFRSPDASWNLVPGEILSVILPTPGQLKPGARSPVSMDPSLTWFEDAAGDLLPYDLEGGTIRLRSDAGGGQDGGGDDGNGDGDDDDGSDDDSGGSGDDDDSDGTDGDDDGSDDDSDGTDGDDDGGDDDDSDDDDSGDGEEDDD